MYFTRFGKLVIEANNCSKAASKSTVTAACILLFKASIIEATTIATGPVVPDITGMRGPSRPAAKHSIIAPHKPAPAPKPVATPNASACGRVIIAELIAPNVSPTTIFDFIFSICAKLIKLILSQILYVTAANHMTVKTEYVRLSENVWAELSL